MDWDDLPGETATHLNDLEQAVDELTRALDQESEPYEDLDEVRMKVAEILGYANAAHEALLKPRGDD